MSSSIMLSFLWNYFYIIFSYYNFLCYLSNDHFLYYQFSVVFVISVPLFPEDVTHSAKCNKDAVESVLHTCCDSKWKILANTNRKKPCIDNTPSLKDGKGGWWALFGSGGSRSSGGGPATCFCSRAVRWCWCIVVYWDRDTAGSWQLHPNRGGGVSLPTSHLAFSCLVLSGPCVKMAGST
jgi:hypothetical protein